MAGLLIRLFIKDSKNTGDPTVRRSCGTALAMLGIAINLLLFLANHVFPEHHSHHSKHDRNR